VLELRAVSLGGWRLRFVVVRVGHVRFLVNGIILSPHGDTSTINYPW
jgi:hypothetical protein